MLKALKFLLFFHSVPNAAVPAVDADEELRKMNRKSEDLERFWRDILPIMDHAPDTSTLHDVARLSYIVDHSLFQSNPEEEGRDPQVCCCLSETFAYLNS